MGFEMNAEVQNFLDEINKDNVGSPDRIKEALRLDKEYPGAQQAFIAKANRLAGNMPHPDLVCMDDVEEKEASWLVSGYIPRYQITLLCGDGGIGKTYLWCDLVAAVSSGTASIFSRNIPEDFAECPPERVLVFSAEDDAEHVLKRRLRESGAFLNNIMHLPMSSPNFTDVYFGSPYLEQLIDSYRPDLVVFDPVQGFVPSHVDMRARNAMRSCMTHLVGMGEKYECTFLITVHSNKMAGVWGRKRMADSADLWDISRSVLMVGESDQEGVNYVSQEKSNYGPRQDTLLYSLCGNCVKFEGFSSKRDRDFVLEAAHTVKAAPVKNQAREFILEFLSDKKEHLSSELEEAAAAAGISQRTLKRVRTELKEGGLLKIYRCGQGKTQKWYVVSTTV